MFHNKQPEVSQKETHVDNRWPRKLIKMHPIKLYVCAILYSSYASSSSLYTTRSVISHSLSRVLNQRSFELIYLDIESTSKRQLVCWFLAVQNIQPILTNSLTILTIFDNCEIFWCGCGATCISCKLVHQVEPLALVQNFVIMWLHLHLLQSWLPG